MDQNRYFIGIALPDDITEVIADLQHTNYTGDSMLQPLVAHLTLLHPNALLSLSPMYLLPKASEAARQFLPIEIKLTELSWFDERVLHIAVESAQLQSLHEQLVALLPDHVRAQYYVGRRFTPHITLAQAKPMQKLSPQLADIYRHRLGGILPYSFTAPHLSSFTWQRPRRYEVRAI